MNYSTVLAQRQDVFFFDTKSLALSGNRIWLHVFFWGCYFVYEGLIWGMVDGAYWERSVSTLIELPVKIAATYFTLYILIDRLLMKRQYVNFMISLTGSMVGFGILLRADAYYFIYPVFYPQGTTVPLLYFHKVLIAIFSTYTIVGTVSAFHIMTHWHRHQQATQQMEKEKIESELQVLKAQINPHFLFNTLNSLYVLTLNQSKNAPEVVHKLSELMSYMLYDSNQPEVPLSKELGYIKNYIGLERIRHESKVDVIFNVFSKVDDVKIAPLIILPFVENAFKHGLYNDEATSFISINISLSGTMVVLKIENSKPQPGYANNKRVSGIGLANVRKRLELIYPERYDLQVIDEDDSFLVILKLELGAGKKYSKDSVEASEAK